MPVPQHLKQILKKLTNDQHKDQSAEDIGEQAMNPSPAISERSKMVRMADEIRKKCL